MALPFPLYQLSCFLDACWALTKNGKKNTIVIKIGGSTLGKSDSSLSDIIKLSKENISPIIVHGGGKEINKWIARQGIHPEFINGLRRTDKDTRDVAASVLSGLINNTIVSEIQNLRGNATGLSGISNSLFECKLLSEELGYVGKIIKVNSEIIKKIINIDSIPVIAPLGINIYSKQTDDNILNINAIDLIRKNEKQFKELNLSENELKNTQLLIDSIIKYPKIMQRPIILNKKKGVIGRPPENIYNIL